MWTSSRMVPRWCALGLVLTAAAAHAVETVRIDMGIWTNDLVVSGGALTLGADLPDGAMTPVSAPRLQMRNESGALRGLPTGLEAQSVRIAGASQQAISVGGKWVRGEVVVRLAAQGVQAINVLPLEDYVAGVLGGEMPRSFPAEALKAQAVAARTYALERKLQAYDLPFHLGSTVLHQVYGGLRAESAKIRAAVRDTEGEVLSFGLRPIEAYFHASCGGRTESGQSALGRALPYLQSVDCPCAGLSSSRWSLELATSELERTFGRRARGVAVAERSATGRVRRVRLGGTSVDAVSFRRSVGYNRLKSLSFDVRQAAGDVVRLEGRGFGHGAGLCQWGAKAYAEQGKDYQDILLHYYPGAELQRIY